ncbi:ABC transporter substrate-binding protein [Herbiconiux sp. L3-i23]|uniref:ABC transporter substrate-binding protein n=1 Tax=Herbiconiux sp. L3-i23 TaxID=2905871 RepID=UPI0020526F4D|nr:ABC transporter substrate-binding protein [Herbiconiux sp. L3-i23]BDI23100.1 glycine/betaine ABC transporter permease [Herbiconiux sp. L3-i23]
MNTARGKGRFGRGRFAVGAIAVGAVIALAGCASGDPLESGSDSDASETEAIVIGSQAYYSNEIIAEIYAQALENAGFEVERNFQIGQREAYLPAIEDGEVDLFPEYSGNLLQYYDPETEAKTSDDVYAALQDALPEGLRVLDQAPATDQDSYVVTRAFADENNVASIADLANVSDVVLGGNSELETRPYGPEGLSSVYGVTVSFLAIEDSGGPVTVQSLKDGSIDVGNIYTGDPNIGTNDLVVLDDPEGLFLASNVVPIASEKVTDDIAAVINEVDAALTPEDLVALNGESVNDQLSSAEIATKFLEAKGLV